MVEWTTKDMISRASKWSLAEDAHLLSHLEYISNDLLAKAEQTNDNLTNLLGSLNNATLKLDILKKEFGSLHNTQFIESRIYEHDYSVSHNEEVEDKSTTAKRIEWKDAIHNGIAIINQYYDKVEVTGSDSEDETDFTSYVLKPKDPYIDRPLPYVIGTDEWHKKWHIGLLDTSSESEDEADVEFSSDSESTHRGDKTRFVSDILPDTIKQAPVANSTFVDIINHSGLLESNDSEENNNSVPVHAPLSSNVFAQELARKLGNVSGRVSTINEPEVNTKPIKSHTSSRVIGNLFNDEPPPLEDGEDLFSAHTGLFSGRGGLFDDLPNNEAIKPAVPKTDLGNFFDDNQPHMFSNSMNDVDPSSQKARKYNLFDDDDDLFDDGDLFKDVTTNSNKKSYIPQSNIGAIPFFDNEPPELELPPATKETVKKPIGGIKLFGDAGNIFAKPTISDFKQIDAAISSSKAIKVPTKADKLLEDSHNGSINSIRILDSDAKSQAKPINLFDDVVDDIFDDDLFSDISVKKFTSNLFSDNIVEDTLFNPIQEYPASTTKPEEVENNNQLNAPSSSEVLNQTPQQNKSHPVNINLFDENPPELEDLWESKSDQLYEDNENVFDSTVDIVGQHSGMFDSEPPSLFSESSGIIKDMTYTRVETDDSFNPFASSSRRFSSDIYNEQQSDDSFFVTKSSIMPSTLDIILEISSVANSTASEVNANIVKYSLFDEEARNETFGESHTIESDTANLFCSSRNEAANLDKLFESDVVQKVVFEGGDKKSRVVKEQDDSSGLVKGEMLENDDLASKIGSPKKLKHNLNINVNALKPVSGGIVVNKATIQTNLFEDHVIQKHVTEITEAEEHVETNENLDVADEVKSQILSSITKERAKIPVKRRPSTRKARQEAMRNSIADFRISSTENFTPEDQKHSGSIANITESNATSKSLSTAIEDRKSSKDISKPVNFQSNLFDDPEDFDDLFSSVKLPPRSNILKQSLFDDEDDDDDIFSSSTAKGITIASTSKSKTMKTAQIKKLENTAATEDPLSRMLK